MSLVSGKWESIPISTKVELCIAVVILQGWVGCYFNKHIKECQLFSDKIYILRVFHQYFNIFYCLQNSQFKNLLKRNMIYQKDIGHLPFPALLFFFGGDLKFVWINIMDRMSTIFQEFCAYFGDISCELHFWFFTTSFNE